MSNEMELNKHKSLIFCVLQWMPFANIDWRVWMVWASLFKVLVRINRSMEKDYGLIFSSLMFKLQTGLMNVWLLFRQRQEDMVGFQNSWMTPTSPDIIHASGLCTCPKALDIFLKHSFQHYQAQHKGISNFYHDKL